MRPSSGKAGRRSMMRRLPSGAGLLVVLAAGVSMTPSAQAPAPTRVTLTAERFDFFPSRIRAEAGSTLEISIESEDTLHGFRIVGTDVNVAVPKRGRGPVTVTFRPEKPGRYIFECSRMCGAGHNFMRGEIIVSEPGAR